jgi:hypothetical protein
MSGSHQRSSSTWHCVSPLLGDSRAGVPYQAASCRSREGDGHLIRDDRRSCKGPHRTGPGCPVTGAEDSVPRREAGMAEEVTARVSRYILDGSDDVHR